VTGRGSPLFIIDGQVVNNATNITGSAISSTTSPNRLNDLNPNDIASMEVLSGAAGAAIYGSLAGNGVVLITTKKGRAGRTTYALRSSYSNDRAISTLPFQQRFGVGTGSASPACVTGGPANCFLSAGFFSWGAPIAAGTQTFNQVSEIFEPGYQLDNTLNVSGGNERTTFFLSGGANNQNGYYVTGNDKFNRYTGRLNASHRAADQLVLGGNVLYARTGLNAFGRGNNTNGMLLPALRTPPNFDNRQGVNGEGLHRAWRYPNPSGPAAIARQPRLRQPVLRGQRGRDGAAGDRPHARRLQRELDAAQLAEGGLQPRHRRRREDRLEARPSRRAARRWAARSRAGSSTSASSTTCCRRAPRSAGRTP
jgi:TonB-dependent SusC/RagA subfamily outer membrane receptor